MTFSDDKSSNIRARPMRQQDRINRQSQVVTDALGQQQNHTAVIVSWYIVWMAHCFIVLVIEIILIGENKTVHLVGLVMSRVDWETDTDIFLQWVGSCWFILFTHLLQRLLWQAGEKKKKKFCMSLREVWQGWCSLSLRAVSVQPSFLPSFWTSTIQKGKEGLQINLLHAADVQSQLWVGSY